MKTKIISVIVLLFLLSTISFSQQQSLLEIREKPTIKIISDSLNSKITIEYTIPEPAFVDLRIFDRLGYVVAAPVFTFNEAGEHSVIFSKNNLNAGYHVVELCLNHDRESAVNKRFEYKIPGKFFTSSKKEDNYLNRAMMTTAQAPEKSKLLYDTLLTQYPHWINRRILFPYALSTYMIVSDSLSVYALIDSIEKYSPNSDMYNYIAMGPAYLKKYLKIGIKYAQKAIDNVNDVPLPYRNSRLFDYQRILGQNYLSNGDYDLAIKSFIDALTTFHSLPSYDRYVKYESDIDILNNLGLLYEKKKDYNKARSYYKISLARDPANHDNWLALQRIYIFLNHSDEGYNSYKENFIKTIPKEKLTETKSEKYVGKTFPRFTLSTIDNKKYSDSDIKGKVTVINYWAYWCGTCLDERADLEKIYKEVKNENFTLLSMHSRIGVYDNYKEEKELVEKVLKKYPASFPTLIEENDYTNPRLGVDAVPTTLILDKKGIVRFEIIGYDKFQFYERMRKNIKQLLLE